MNTDTIRSSTMPPRSTTTGSPESAFANFRRHVGMSGRTYLVSVYPIDRCPDYVDAVVIAVGIGPNGGATLVWIGDTGTGGTGLRATLAAAAQAGACEAHVHLLACDAAARAAVVRDLDARH